VLHESTVVGVGGVVNGHIGVEIRARYQKEVDVSEGALWLCGRVVRRKPI
jgi:hypothetical protein